MLKIIVAAIATLALAGCASTPRGEPVTIHIERTEPCGGSQYQSRVTYDTCYLAGTLKDGRSIEGDIYTRGTVGDTIRVRCDLEAGRCFGRGTVID